jgi:hypothetical protein
MTKYTADAPLQPKGAHNRRLSLGIDPDRMAAEAGITTEQLRDYERTSPDHDFDVNVARLVHEALERLEQIRPNHQTGRSDHHGHHAPIIAHDGEGMDHSQHRRLDESELDNRFLEGAPIYDSHNDQIGKVSHLHGTGPFAQVIVDVGGFLGLGTKPVALSMSQFDFMRDQNGTVHAVTTLTKEQLEAMPEHHHHH